MRRINDLSYFHRKVRPMILFDETTKENALPITLEGADQARRLLYMRQDCTRRFTQTANSSSAP